MSECPTAAELVRLSAALEEDTARYYEALASRFPDRAEQLNGWARDSRKNALHIQRTYQETISDALEACFAFEGLDAKAFAAPKPPDSGSWDQACAEAAAMETRTITLLNRLADMSQNLLGTMSDAFRSAAVRRAKRGVATGL